VDPVFPAFAGLARSSTWFRNATTVSASGGEAVPALLSGKRPEPGRLPIFQNHRENLFTLLGADYRLNVHETQTRLCPPELCERRDDPDGAGVRSLLSDAGATWGRVVAPPRLESRLPEPDPERSSFADTGVFDAERERRFRNFLRSLRFELGEEPSLDLIHLRLPQGPWTRFPNGSQSAIPGGAPARGGEAEALQAWQRHLLQAGYADRLLGLLVNSSGRAHGRNARRLVHAARNQDRRLACALLAAAVASFAIGEGIEGGAIAAIVVLNAAFGLPTGAAAWPWWSLGAVHAAVGALILLGIAAAGREKPIVP